MIVFGSRRSDLAMRQTRMCAEQLCAATGEDWSIAEIETTGDRVTDRPLDAIGVKGAFTVELEAALRNGEIAAAVHSLKDLPVDPPDGLAIGAVPARAAVEDVLIVDPGAVADDGAATADVPLRTGVRVGTSSPRRRLALSIARPDLDLADIRGNVPTRVDKVRRGEYGAVVLAAAGLDRLGLDLTGLERRPLPVGVCTPAPGQGALAIQCRADDGVVGELLGALHDPVTAACVTAERDLLAALGGGCSLPLGALATAGEHGYRLRASLFGGPGPAVVRADVRGTDLSALVADLGERWRPLMGERLAGLRLALIRPDGEPGELAAALGVAGARVDVLGWTRTEDVAPDPEVLRSLESAGALAFTSARAVARFVSLARSVGRSPADLGPCFAAGPATADALRAHGIDPLETPPGRAGGDGLAVLVAEHVQKNAAVLFPCAEGRHAAFERRLTEHGHRVTALPVYRTVLAPDAPGRSGQHDVFLFSSPSAVEAFRARGEAFDGARIAIGETTAEALRAAGLSPRAVAARPTPAAVIDALEGSVHVGKT